MNDFINDERIVAWLDGELSSDEATQLETQLADNPQLQANVNQMRSIKTAIQLLPRERAPRNFTLNVNEYGTAPRKRFSFFSVWARYVLGVAGIVLVSAVIFNQFQLSSNNDPVALDPIGSADDEIAAIEERSRSANQESEESGVYASEIEADVVAIEAELETDAESVAAEADSEEFETAESVVGQSGDEATMMREGVADMDVTEALKITDTITTTDGITGTGGLYGTIGDTSADSWGDALNDLTLGFLILLLVICLFVFGLGMWILLNRHQR